MSGYVFATKARIDNRKKNLLSSNISSTCSHSLVNFGPLAAEINPVVFGTPANLNGFRVLASLLQRRRSTEANQTLHDVWPLPGLVDCIYFRRLLPRNLPGAIYFASSKSCALLLAALLHGTRAVGASQTLRRWSQGWGRHLYSAGRPSRWASAHILVHFDLFACLHLLRTFELIPVI